MLHQRIRTTATALVIVATVLSASGSSLAQTPSYSYNFPPAIGLSAELTDNTRLPRKPAKRTSTIATR
jgi:hypothetical protein